VDVPVEPVGQGTGDQGRSSAGVQADPGDELGLHEVVLQPAEQVLELGEFAAHGPERVRRVERRHLGQHVAELLERLAQVVPVLQVVAPGGHPADPPESALRVEDRLLRDLARRPPGRTGACVPQHVDPGGQVPEPEQLGVAVRTDPDAEPLDGQGPLTAERRLQLVGSRPQRRLHPVEETAEVLGEHVEVPDRRGQVRQPAEFVTEAGPLRLGEDVPSDPQQGPGATDRHPEVVQLLRVLVGQDPGFVDPTVDEEPLQDQGEDPTRRLRPVGGTQGDRRPPSGRRSGTTACSVVRSHRASLPDGGASRDGTGSQASATASTSSSPNDVDCDLE